MPGYRLGGPINAPSVNAKSGQHCGQPPPTRLVTMRISKIANAGRIIGESQFHEDGSRIAPLVLIPNRSFLGGVFKPFIAIPNGFSAVVTKYGRFLGVWRPGHHWAGPHTRISHLITKQYMIFDYPIKECPTHDNVMVEIDITLVFHILQGEDELKSFVYKLGPEKLDKMLKAFQEETVREIARKRKYNQIYDLMNTRDDEQLKNSMRRMNTNMLEYGVEVVNITITNVHLPKSVAQTMESASGWSCKNAFNGIKQNYELLKIDNDEHRIQRKQKVLEDHKEMQTLYDKKMTVARAKLKEIQADTEKIIAEIKEKTEAKVLEITSKSELEVAKANTNKRVDFDKTESHGRAEVNRIKSETRANIEALKAQADRNVATNKAKALEFKAKAERSANRSLAQKRKFEQKMRHLEALRKLSINNQVCVSGSDSGNLLASVLSATRQTSVLGLNMKDMGIDGQMMLRG